MVKKKKILDKFLCVPDQLPKLFRNIWQSFAWDPKPKPCPCFGLPVYHRNSGQLFQSNFLSFLCLTALGVVSRNFYARSRFYDLWPDSCQNRKDHTHLCSESLPLGLHLLCRHSVLPSLVLCLQTFNQGAGQLKKIPGQDWKGNNGKEQGPLLQTLVQTSETEGFGGRGRGKV